jgi:hypothetical protein
LAGVVEADVDGVVLEVDDVVSVSPVVPLSAVAPLSCVAPLSSGAPASAVAPVVADTGGAGALPADDEPAGLDGEGLLAGAAAALGAGVAGSRLRGTVRTTTRCASAAILADGTLGWLVAVAMTRAVATAETAPTSASWVSVRRIDRSQAIMAR